ncbi:hypothetical protein QYF36_013739 [Acer negundo]|nr:hypothetical protein QYF36_013739 [Acer negundo]
MRPFALASVLGCLKDFLGDETICFVGTYLEDKTYIDEDKVKVTITSVPKTTPDWNPRFFTEEEVEYAIFQARYCYRVGNLMLSKLNM